MWRKYGPHRHPLQAAGAEEALDAVVARIGDEDAGVAGAAVGAVAAAVTAGGTAAASRVLASPALIALSTSGAKTGWGRMGQPRI